MTVFDSVIFVSGKPHKWRHLWSLRETEIFFRMKFFFQLKKLFTSEGRPPASGLRRGRIPLVAATVAQVPCLNEKHFEKKIWNNKKECSTECARDRDLYELVSCCKFVNEILFCDIYKTLYLTWGHLALGVILCLCLNFFELSTAELIFQSQRSLKN